MTDMSQTGESRINRAMSFMASVNEAESVNRTRGKADLRFSFGDQWEYNDIQARNQDRRPCLTINKTGAYCRQVENQQRQQRPRIRVHAVNDEADKKIADIIGGLMRHIEVNSNAETAYDTAFAYAVRVGWGYWRIRTGYPRSDSFDQEIFIDTLDNPFSVWFDDNSIQADGSDAERCLIAPMMSKRAFKSRYPSANDGASFKGDDASWITPDQIRVGEFYEMNQVKKKLYLMADGKTMWADNPYLGRITDEMKSLVVVGERESMKKKITWTLMTAMEELETSDIIGEYIPVVPIYGNVEIVDGKRLKSGVVRDARDPQRMVNFAMSAQTESIGLAPKAKWLMAAGQDEGFESEWQQANVSARATLHYNIVDVSGKPIGPPTRLQPEPPPTGILEMEQTMNQALTSVLGIVDPAMRIGGNVSGKALQSERMQSDTATFNFYDNLTRSMRHTGKVILAWIPWVYDTQRVVRIIGDDGKPKQIAINEQALDSVQNDVTTGEYDVVMDTGPGYNSKREQAVDAMMPLFERDPELMKVAGDVMFRNMDFPGAEQIADRLAAANPLSKIDEESDVPPQAQMMIKQQAQQIEQMGKALQELQTELKLKGGIEGMKQAAATHRTQIQADQADRSDRMWSNEEREQFESVQQTKYHDTAVKAQTALSVAEMNNATDLLIKRIEERLAEKAAKRETEKE